MHPVFIQIGSFYIGTYGVMLALALIAGTLVILGRARRVGVEAQTVMDLVFYTVLGGMAGGRLAHILVYHREFFQDPLGMIFSRTGFVFLGSVIGSVGVVVYVVWKRRLNFWVMADVLITALPLGHFFGRLGCFTAGCCYGAPLAKDGFWGFLAVRFPKGERIGDAIIGGQAYEEHYQMGLEGLDSAAGTLETGAEASLPVWPVQLFEAAGNLVLFAALLALWRVRKFNGQIFLTYLTAYSAMRFCFEFIRGDTGRGRIGFLSTSQALCALAAVFVLLSWRRLRRGQDLDLARQPAPPNDRRPAGKRKKRKGGAEKMKNEG